MEPLLCTNGSSENLMRLSDKIKRGHYLSKCFPNGAPLINGFRLRATLTGYAKAEIHAPCNTLPSSGHTSYNLI